MFSKYFRPIIVFSLILFFPLKDIFAQGLNSWVQKNSFTGTSRTNAVSFSILGKGYMGTGKDSSGAFLADFWEYDAGSDTWTQLADFSGTARSAAVGFGIDSAGYIGLGDDGLTFLKDLWKYNPINNSWSQEQDLGLYQSANSLGRRDAAVTVLTGKAYIICGYDGTTSNSKQCWEFDPVADTSWTLKRNFANATDFTVIGRRWAVAFNVNANSSIYFGTGFDQIHSYKKDLWRLNTATDVWTQMADLPGQTRANATAFALHGKGYVLCGSNVNQKFDMYRYDPVINSWTMMADYPGAASANNITFVLNNRAYVGMGNDSMNVCQQDLWEYIPDSTTGINDVELIADLEIFPMPVVTSYRIKISGQQLKFPISYTLYDIRGKLVDCQRIHEKSSLLSREHIISGVHIYSMTYNGRIIKTGKLIFQ